MAMSGFVGRPMPGVQIEALDGGEIRVCSAAVGLGYFPIETDDLSAAGFKPADLLEATPEGWRITGRRTDVINIGGKKADPSEIESVLLAHPAVREAVVFGLGSAARTEAVCACVVTDDEVDVAMLRAYCAERLAPWQVPRTVIRLTEIPVNARGKISRAALAERFSTTV
jgi:acyl-coenzyme A synthetase/AMP-(fatty) acid ligase